ncbi:MAG: hypothetical protein GQ477_02830 [Nanohaloarchaea archaeon]|nr:hypothetical protein [Candidatus Nanohaloarchaea archaeon]
MQKFISEKLSCLPDISDKDYKVEEFIIHNLKNMKKLCYGCVYQNGNERFLLLKEENANISEFVYLDNSEFKNIPIYYGHIPSFLLAKNMIETSRNYVSWIQDKEIFTLIHIRHKVEQDIQSLNDMLKNDKLINIFNIITDAKNCFGTLAYFKVIENIPTTIQKFKLETLYFIFTYESNNPKNIMILLKSNFSHKEQNEVFVNIEMGFSYMFSESFEEFSENFKKQKEIYESKNQDNIIEYLYIDSDEKFYIKCSNNETSLKFKNDVLSIMTYITENMKGYSCVEETMLLGKSRR